MNCFTSYSTHCAIAQRREMEQREHERRVRMLVDVFDPIVELGPRRMVTTATGIVIGGAYTAQPREQSADADAIQASYLAKPEPNFEELKSPLWLALLLGAGIAGLLIVIFTR